MRKITVLYYPRTTKHEFKEEINGEFNPDYVGDDNLPENKIDKYAYDYSDPIRANLYFDDSLTTKEINSEIYTINNSGFVSISKWWEVKPKDEE